MGIIGSSYVAEAAAINALMGFIVVIILVSLLGIAAQVLLGLATYNDAKARGNSDPAMWGLLVGILGWIPGIVYLCVRNHRANRLMACLPTVWIRPPGGGALLSAVPCTKSVQRAVSKPSCRTTGTSRKAFADLGNCGLCCGDSSGDYLRVLADCIIDWRSDVLTASEEKEKKARGTIPRKGKAL